MIENPSGPESSGYPFASAGSTGVRQILARQRLLLDHGPSFLIELTPGGRIDWVSANAGPRLGVAADALPGTNLFSCIHPLDTETVSRELAAPWGRGTFRWLHGDGSLRWIDFVVRDSGLDGGPVERRTMVATDTTREKLLEAEHCELETYRKRSRPLETLGTLAATVAHDFNNLLGGITAYTDLARSEMPPHREIHSYLDQVMLAASRAKALTRQILTFSRPPMPERKRIGLDAIITEVTNLLRPTWPVAVHVHVEVEHGVNDVSVDTAQIHQALMNLCTNARHAIGSNQGRIEIRLQNHTVNEVVGTGCAELAPGAYVRLSVSDTGSGMDAATLRRVFEPFFSTRCPGTGTGLGLSIVREIVKAHGGAVQIHSQPNAGTTVDLIFPACPAPEKSNPTVGSQRPSGNVSPTASAGSDAATPSTFDSPSLSGSKPWPESL